MYVDITKHYKLNGNKSVSSRLTFYKVYDNIAQKQVMCDKDGVPEAGDSEWLTKKEASRYVKSVVNRQLGF